MDTAMDGPGWRCLWDAGCTLGEGPIWDPAAGVVRFVDIERCQVHRFAPATGEHGSWTAPCRIGSIGLRDGGGLVAGSAQGFATLDPDAGTFAVIDDPEAHLPANRFNDGKVDPHGNFWAGTMDDTKRDRSGVLYCLRPDRSWAAIDLGYRITNGPAFSPDGGTLYHTDTLDRTTFAFDLAADGTVAARRVFRNWRDVSGNPDGMTTDAAGHLWIAFWGGSCLRRVAPTGQSSANSRCRSPTSRARRSAAPVSTGCSSPAPAPNSTPPRCAISRSPAPCSRLPATARPACPAASGPAERQ